MARRINNTAGGFYNMVRGINSMVNGSRSIVNAIYNTVNTIRNIARSFRNTFNDIIFSILVRCQQKGGGFRFRKEEKEITAPDCSGNPFSLSFSEREKDWNVKRD